MQGAPHLAAQHQQQQHHMLYADPAMHMGADAGMVMMGGGGVGAGAPLAQMPMAPATHPGFDPDNPKHAGLAKLAELRECVDDVSKDSLKFFEKGNKAAGVRARKKLQTLKALAQELRINIQKCKAELAAAGPASGQDDHGHGDDDGDALG
jgi:hypothetical protein